MPFYSTKRFGPISTSHRNWVAETNTNRNSQKCAMEHGYSRYVELTFSGETDRHQWVYDFGDAKEIKEIIEAAWDHKLLINSNDPKMDLIKKQEEDGLIYLTVMDVTQGHGAGIEGSCKWVYDVAQPIVTRKTEGRVKIVKVQIWEHENNSAIYVPDDVSCGCGCNV